MKLDVVGTWVAFGLTLLAYAYLGKEIPFFDVAYRIVAYLFVGVALAYAAVQAWHGVLVPRLLTHLGAREWFYLVPLLLCLILLSRVRRSWQSVSWLTLACLFGVGAALAAGAGHICFTAPGRLPGPGSARGHVGGKLCPGCGRRRGGYDQHTALLYLHYSQGSNASRENGRADPAGCGWIW
jgi:hypothetical protein